MKVARIDVDGDVLEGEYDEGVVTTDVESVSLLVGNSCVSLLES